MHSLTGPQLAVIASYQEDSFAICYFYFRSILAAVPFSTARDNLSSMLRKQGAVVPPRKEESGRLGIPTLFRKTLSLVQEFSGVFSNDAGSAALVSLAEQWKATCASVLPHLSATQLLRLTAIAIGLVPLSLLQENAAAELVATVTDIGVSLPIYLLCKYVALCGGGTRHDDGLDCVRSCLKR